MQQPPALVEVVRELFAAEVFGDLDGGDPVERLALVQVAIVGQLDAAVFLQAGGTDAGGAPTPPGTG